MPRLKPVPGQVLRTVACSDWDIEDSKKQRKSSASSSRQTPLFIISKRKEGCTCCVCIRDLAGKLWVFAGFNGSGRIAYNNPYRRPKEQEDFVIEICNFCKERGKKLSHLKQRQLRSLGEKALLMAFPLKKQHRKARNSSRDRRRKPHIARAAIDYVKRNHEIPIKDFIEDLCQKHLPDYKKLQDEKTRGPQRRNFMKSVRKCASSAAKQAGTNDKGWKKRMVAILQRKLNQSLELRDNDDC